MIDRDRLDQLLAGERSRFVELHPRSAELAAEARPRLLGGVPMAWMTRWPGAVPRGGHRGRRRPRHRRRRRSATSTSRSATPGRWAATPGRSSPRRVARAGRARHHHDAAVARRGLGGRRAGPSLRPARRGSSRSRATDANRFALRLARHLTGRPKVAVFDWCYHGTVDETLVMLGPDGTDGAPTRQRRAAGRPGADDPGGAVQRRRGARGGAGGGRRGLRAGRAGPHQHRDRPARAGVPRRAPRPPPRETGTLLVIDETHTICTGPGGYTAAYGLRARPAHHRQADRRWRAGRGLRHDARRWPPARRVAVTTRASTSAASAARSTGNALSVAAMRAALSQRACAPRTSTWPSRWPSAGPTASAAVIDAHGLPWTVQRLGCRAEYWFCPPPRDGAAAAAAVDPELEAFLHLWSLNRGVLLTPFHNMALLSSSHTARRRRPPHRGVRRGARRPHGVAPGRQLRARLGSVDLRSRPTSRVKSAGSSKSL